jgi:hypothetical protein
VRPLAAGAALLLSLLAPGELPGAPAAPAGAPASEPEAPCSRGERSTLEVRAQLAPSPPRLHGPGPRTVLVLRGTDGVPLRTETWDGAWRCLTPSPGARGHVVGGVAPRGAWRPLASVLFVPADGSPAVPSAFDRGRYQALAALVSPEGRQMAFVGGVASVDGLYLLDLRRDTVRRLGPAPAPPATPEARAVCGGESFGWGGCWADGLVELEPSVLRFASEALLEVSTGADGPQGRARARKVTRYRVGP